MIKVNCYGAWDGRTGKGGIGVIARNEQNAILAGRNTQGRAISAISTEAMAVLQGVELTVHHKWSDVIIETDAQVIIQML